jgi:seryl-tRNA synthetase
MLDINFVRENSELVKKNILKKFKEDKLVLVDDVLNLDSEWRKIKYDEDLLRSKRNKLSKDVADSMKSKDLEKAEEIKKEAKRIPEEIEKLEERRKDLEIKIKEIMYKIPNMIHDSVPIGKDDSENVELEKIGEPKVPKYEIFNHAELAEKLNSADFDTARKTSGNGFYYLKGDLSRLHYAMFSFAREFMIKQGFEL